MNLLKKIAAGFLLLWGFFFIALAVSEVVDPGVDEDEPSVIAGTLILGIPPTAFGIWLLWDAARQKERQKQDRLRSIFFRQVEAGGGYVNLLNFVMETSCSTDEARQYLDERAKEFNATFEVDEQGGVLYYFNLLKTRPAAPSDAASPSVTSTPSRESAPIDHHRAESSWPMSGGSTSVILEAFPANQIIAVIKVIREVTGLGLKEAKERAERLPSVVVAGVSQPSAEQLKQQLEALGATVRLQDQGDSNSYAPEAGETVTVILEAFPRDRVIDVIRLIREATGLGLKEAKELADTLPSVILASVNPTTASQVKQQFEAIEATIRLQYPENPA